MKFHTLFLSLALISSGTTAVVASPDDGVSFGVHRKLQDGFCKDMRALETHMNEGFSGLVGDDIGNYTVRDGYICACNEEFSVLEIECLLYYKYNTSIEFDTQREVIKFEVTGGIYQTTSVDLYDTIADTDGVFEAYTYQGGEIASCTGAAECTSCTVCDDKSSMAFDCAAWVNWEYTIPCSEMYTGAFANTFDFGTINVPAKPSVSIEDFCSDMSVLEAHLLRTFVALYENFDPAYVPGTQSYDCVCGNAEATMEITCTLAYTYEGDSGTSVERMLFERTGGVYQLVSTSWADSLYGNTDPIETYTITDGKASACTPFSGCASCTLCDDGKAFSIDCTAVDAVFNYEISCAAKHFGAAGNTFDFGEITAPTNGSSGAAGSLPQIVQLVGLMALALAVLVVGV